MTENTKTKGVPTAPYFTRTTPVSSVAADGRTSFLFDVAEGEAGNGGDGEAAEVVAEDFFEAEARAFEAAVAAAAEDDPEGWSKIPPRERVVSMRSMRWAEFGENERGVRKCG